MDYFMQFYSFEIFFFLPSDPSTGVKILFHCFHSLNSELGLWMQLDDRAPKL